MMENEKAHDFEAGKSNMPLETDDQKQIIIVGAGIVGASTAYHLAKKGMQVTVVDRKDAGQATEAAAGIICPWLSQRRNKAWYALAKNGAAYYEKMIAMLEEDGERETGYRKVGAMSLHTDEGKLEKMVERALMRREDAPEIGDIRLLSSEETRANMPYIDESYAAVHVSGAARVNGRALRDALLSAAKKHCAQFVYGSAELVVENDVVCGVKVDGEILLADEVCITAGAWAGELLESHGVSLQIRGQKAQIAHLKVADETENWPVVMPPNNQYMLAFDGGEIVIGATYEDERHDLDVTVGGLHEIFDKALTVAPGLKNANFTETKIGFRPVVPNFMPVIGRVPKLKGAWLVNGLGSSGLTVGPFLGSELAKLVTDEMPTLDMTPYDVEQIVEE